jgi:hypothetical protein
MRQGGAFVRWVVMLSCVVLVSGCGLFQKKPVPRSGPKRALSTAEASPTYDTTPVPTVPPAPITPEPTPAPLRTRPTGTGKEARKGEVIGPQITFFGAARADGTRVEPQSVDKDGVPTYLSSAGSGFMLVVEGKPGESSLEVSRRVFAYVPNDPKVRPDLEIESSRDLGNGSPQVCDRQRPNIGGIPGVNPPSFAETERISNAINDFSCRFETFIESESSCTLSPSGDYAFLNPQTTTQFCMIVAKAYAFPVGDTLLSVRLRDADGNPGPVKQMRIRRPPAQAPAAK